MRFWWKPAGTQRGFVRAQGQVFHQTTEFQQHLSPEPLCPSPRTGPPPLLSPEPRGAPALTEGSCRRLCWVPVLGEGLMEPNRPVTAQHCPRGRCSVLAPGEQQQALGGGARVKSRRSAFPGSGVRAGLCRSHHGVARVLWCPYLVRRLALGRGGCAALAPLKRL